VRILVCGSRNYPVDHVLPALLESYWRAVDSMVLIEGGAPGADRHAKEWARCHGVPVWEYKAEWSEHGRAAGPIRNERMLGEGRPDLVLAFVNKPLLESRGTADMVRRARDAGVPTYVIESRCENP
jgi:hypothetical protein